MPPRVLTRAALLVTLAVHLVALLWTPYLSHDAAAYISAGQMLLRGAWPGAGIVDTNPPMVTYLAALPAAAAPWLGVTPAAAGVVFLFGLIAGGGLLFVRAVRAVRSVPPWAEDLLLALWFAFSLRCYWSLGPTALGGDFGQRDTIIFAWLAPFIVVRGGRYTGTFVPPRLACAVAVCAAAAIAMKPFFLLPLAAAELSFAVASRRFRPLTATVDWWLVVGLQVVYLAATLLQPGGIDLFTNWMPQVVRGYSAYSSPVRVVLGRAVHDAGSTLWLAGLATLCSHPFWKKERPESLPGAFGFFGAAALVVYVVHAKGWRYQLWPSYGAVTIGLALLLVDAARDRSFSRTRLAAVACTCGAVLSLVVPSQLWPASWLAGRLSRPPLGFEKDGVAQAVEALSTERDRILVLSTSVPDAYPALTYTSRLPATRFVGCAFPVAFYFSESHNYEVPARWRDEERAFYAALTDDVRRYAPRLVFVRDAPGQALPPEFRMVEYLARRGFFRDALTGYQAVGRVGVLMLYVRGDAPGRNGPGQRALADGTRDVLRDLVRRGVVEE